MPPSSNFISKFECGRPYVSRTEVSFELVFYIFFFCFEVWISNGDIRVLQNGPKNHLH